MHVARPHLSPVGMRDAGLDLLRRRVGRRLDAEQFQRDPDYICEHLPTAHRLLTTPSPESARPSERSGPSPRRRSTLSRRCRATPV
jgi:hypothetical protein